MTERLSFSAFKSRIDWKTVAIVLFIFLLAFGIRAYLFRYDLMFEFDTYWHTRMTGYIIQNGSIPAVDPLAYTHLPNGSAVPMRTSLFWYVSAFIYSIIAFVTTGSAAYDKELLIEVVKFLPAFYGAIVSVGLYFLGKEAYNKTAGYLMGFFGAVSSSFIYRSLAGFYEAGTFGYVLLVFGFYFLLRAVNRLSNWRLAIINAAIGCILLGLLSISYALSVIVIPILVFFAVFSAWSLWNKGQKDLASRFVYLMAGFLVGFALLALLLSGDTQMGDVIGYPSTALEKIGIPPLFAAVFFGLVAIGALLWYKIRSKVVSTESWANKANWLRMLVLFLLLAIGIFSMLAPKNRVGISAISVGEESPGNQYFAHKYGVLMVLPLLALVLIPIADFKKKKPDLASALFFPFILISFYLAWDRLHYSYNFGVPIAIASAYVIYHVLAFFKRHSRYEKLALSFGLGFLVLAGVSHATLFTQQNVPTIEADSGWKEGLYWLKDNTPPDAKLFNWWDEGHWISFLAERKVITDNRNFDRYANSDVGKFVLTEDLSEAISILKKYDSDYLVLGNDLFSKRNSMILYAYYIDNPEKAQEGDPRFDPVQSLSVPCSATTEQGKTVYRCSGATIQESDFLRIPVTWTSQPSALENERDAIFYYRTTDNARLHKLSLKQNSTVFARIWFGSPETRDMFEEVFPDNLPNYKNKELKIFKIHKDRFSS